MDIKPLARPLLTDLVVDRIRALIERGGLQAGDRLPGEMELVRQLQVSRPVLREAIGRLTSVGLLTVQHGRGTFVADRGSLANCAALIRSALAISPKELLSFVEVRVAIECYAVRQAAERATPDQLEQLELLCQQMDAEGVSYADAIHIDFLFHRKLLEIGGNELMQNIFGVVHEFILAGMVHTTPAPRDRMVSQPLHLAILEAVRAHDVVAAEQAMRSHMDNLLARFKDSDVPGALALDSPALPSADQASTRSQSSRTRQKKK